LELERRVWRKKSPGTEEEESGESEYDAAAAAAMELLDVGAAGKG
jgi:hypothetical protein